jgi:hypothetical protein
MTFISLLKIKEKIYYINEEISSVLVPLLLINGERSNGIGNVLESILYF